MPYLRTVLAILAFHLATATLRGQALDPNAYSSLGTLNAVGTVSVNTSNLTLTVGGTTYTGTLGPNNIAVFAFSSVTIANTAIVNLSGSRPLALLSQGDASYDANLAVPAGQLGGHAAMSGPGFGFYGANPTGSGGGGFGGNGGRGTTGPFLTIGGPGGDAYGDLLTKLEGGSGGGRLATTTTADGWGGVGGGAVLLGAVGRVTLSAVVNANGGNGTYVADGGGAGGGILISAGAVTMAGNGRLNANGGGGSDFVQGLLSYTTASGGGGGGRIVLNLMNFTPADLPNFASVVTAAGGLGGDNFTNGPRANSGDNGQRFLSVGTTYLSLGQSLTVTGNQIASGFDFRSSNYQLEAGTLTLDNSSQTISRLDGASGQLRLNNNTTLTIGSGGGDSEYRGTISSSSGTGKLVKVGNNTLSLSGANTYAGGTNVEAGFIRVGANAALGTGAVTVHTGGGLLLTNGVSLGNALTVTGTGLANLGAVRAAGGDATVTGPITMNGSARFGAEVERTLTITGRIGFGTASFGSDSGGTVVLASGDSLFTGTVIDRASTLRLATWGALPIQTSLTMTNGTLDLNGYDARVNGTLAADAASMLRLSGGTFTLRPASTGTTTVPATLRGDGTFAFEGTASQSAILTGNTTAFTGNINVIGGTVTLASQPSAVAAYLWPGATLATTVSLTLRDLGFSGTSGSAAAILQTNGRAVTVTAPLTGSTPLELRGSGGSLTLNGAATGGAITAAEGTLRLKANFDRAVAVRAGAAVTAAAPATVTALSMDTNAFFLVHFNAAGVDRLTAVGTATIDGAKLEVRIAGAGTIPTNEAYTILSAGGLEGTFAGMADGSRFVTADGLGSFVIHYQPTAVVLSQFQPVPEPAFVLAAAVTGTVFVRRRVRRGRTRVAVGSTAARR